MANLKSNFSEDQGETDMHVSVRVCVEGMGWDGVKGGRRCTVRFMVGVCSERRVHRVPHTNHQ